MRSHARRSLAIPALLTVVLACSATPGGDATKSASSVDALAPAGSVLSAVAAYATPDGTMHAIAAAPETIENVDFDGTVVSARRRLGYFAGVVATGAFYAPQDGNQHVLVATDQGDVHEVWFNPAAGVFSDAPLARFTSSITAVDGFTSDDDGREHAIVATADGTITDVSWIPAQGITRTVIGRVTGAIAVDGFYAPDDTNRIVHVATSGGALVEIFYHPGRGGGQSTIATFSGIVDVGGFYTADDQDRHCIVATRDGALTEVYYNPSWGISQARIGSYAGVASVAAFATSDGYRRVVVGTTSGALSELHYSPSQPWGTFALGTYYRPQPGFDDVGPNTANGTIGDVTGAGRVTQLAVASTYALTVSPNAGIWKLPYAADAQAKWIQLAKSPPYANVVAIDPTNEKRIVAGQRHVEGDPYLNVMGLWESSDQGATWGRVFDPIGDPDCAVVTDPDNGHPGTHLIASLAVVPGAQPGTSTTYAGTACGVAIARAGGAYAIHPSTKGNGIVTAIASSTRPDGTTMAWARATGGRGDWLLYSVDDGQTWTTVPIPTTVGGTTLDFSRRGDEQSLAAYGTKALLVATPNAPADATAAVFYDATTATWTVSSVAPTDGTGLNGRRLVKAFPNPGTYPTLVVGTSQDFYVGARWDSSVDRPLAWQHYAATTEAVTSSGPGTSIHGDTWDFAIAKGAPNGPWVLIASDGGVYRFANGQSDWEQLNAGLRVHSAQSVLALPLGHVNRPQLGYATMDNDAWERDGNPLVGAALPWSTPNSLGDAAWVQGDVAVPSIASAITNGTRSMLLDFGHPEANPNAPPPMYTLDCVDEACHGAPIGYGHFHFIQSLWGEPPAPFLDALFIASPPYIQRHPDGSYAPVALPANPNGGPILLRNRAFAQTPATMATLLQPPAWTVEAADLPAGTWGILSSGGHAAPTYYAVVREASGNHLYKHAPGASGWTYLPAAGSFWLEPTWLWVQNVAGPVFVNPYDPNVVVVAGYDASGVGAVRVSNDGGQSFRVDEALTALASESGRIDVTRNYFGGSDLGTPVGMTRHDSMLGALASMTWNRERPREVVAGSVLGGAWFAKDGRTWQSLAPLLPTPRAPVASVAIDPEAASVATFGRGLVRVTGYREAPAATYFRNRTSGGTLAQLVSSSGAPLINTKVDAFVVSKNGTWQFLGTLTTDLYGNLATPSSVAAGAIVNLSFAGTTSLAGATTAFYRAP